jgi:hypothetical protein
VSLLRFRAPSDYEVCAASFKTLAMDVFEFSITVNCSAAPARQGSSQQYSPVQADM